MIRGNFVGCIIMCNKAFPEPSSKTEEHYSPPLIIYNFNYNSYNSDYILPQVYNETVRRHDQQKI